MKTKIIFELDEMVTVYDSFCKSIGMGIPVAILDTPSWKAVGNGYKHDATLYQNGVMIDVDRAECPAFVLAHEFAHIEQIAEGIDISGKRNESIEQDADERAIRILEEAGLIMEEEKRTDTNDKRIKQDEMEEGENKK